MTPVTAARRAAAADERAAARGRHPTARAWRTDPARLQARLADHLVAAGHSAEAARAAAHEAAAHRRAR